VFGIFGISPGSPAGPGETKAIPLAFSPSSKSLTASLRIDKGGAIIYFEIEISLSFVQLCRP
jgi:hypothetical protein